MVLEDKNAISMLVCLFEAYFHEEWVRRKPAGLKTRFLCATPPTKGWQSSTSTSVMVGGDAQKQCPTISLKIPNWQNYVAKLWLNQPAGRLFTRTMSSPSISLKIKKHIFSNHNFLGHIVLVQKVFYSANNLERESTREDWCWGIKVKPY